MATWAIGDIHGCFDSLEALWPRLEFQPDEDRLWLVGDLVNRGPKSLEVLRWARRQGERLGERLEVVLGNHDLHLLALDRGIATAKPRDTLDEILAASDRGPLLAWLRQRSFLVRQDGFLLVHAGLLPAWTPDEARSWAVELEALLGSPAEPGLLARGETEGTDRRSEELRRALFAFTLLRTCSADGEPCRFSGPPAEAPPGCRPWYELWRPAERGLCVVCGHWAAQGLRLEPGMVALDGACVWGGALCAVRLEDRRVVRQPALETPLPVSADP